MRVRLTITASLLAVVASLAMAGGAQAVVVDMNSLGSSTVAYNGADRSGYFGVAMLPGTRSQLSTAPSPIPTVVSGPSCNDPAITSDLAPLLSSNANNAICWHSGPVMHKNETFALTWDGGSLRRSWQGTRGYVEQFLKDVADGAGTLSSPYAETGQYSDASGRAANASAYGGGCIDYGNPGGWTCDFGDTTASGTGRTYPTSACTPSGNSYGFVNPVSHDTTNDVCLTDAQIRQEVSSQAASMGFLSRTRTGYTPLVVVLLPTGVEACLDNAGSLCSANSTAPARFCSYHAHVNVGGTDVAYVVQPWTPYTGCDEPGLPDLPDPPTPEQVSQDAGLRIVNPLSQGQIATITDPQFNGWFAFDGSEVNDNFGCVPLGKKYDPSFVGSSHQNPYYLQREFNNAGVMENEPFAEACTLAVTLTPAFVVPSSPKPGDAVYFDGSATRSTLLVPKHSYSWSFGDGTTAVGPSVEHSYKQPGNYSVKLTVTDRGGNVRSLAQTISVQGTAQSPPPLAWTPSMQLLPQGLKGVLRSGVAVRITSSRPADGMATLLITRGAAKRAHIKVGKGSTVVIGRGTISGVGAGTSVIHLHINRGVAKKLRHVKHLKLTVRIKLFASASSHVSLTAAGNY